MSKRVLVTSRSFGSISDEPFRILRDAGAEVEMMEFSQERFARSVVEADALVIGAHPFDADLLRRCGRLRIICKHGVGLDNIPLDTAREMGIRVANVPHANSDAVADLTFGLILAVARGIVRSAMAIGRGEPGTAIGTDVCGKTLGLVGFGRIARGVAARARGFEMRVLAYDPYVTPDSLPENLSFVQIRDLADLAAECDFLSLHLPLSPETRNMVDRDFIGRMKPGAYLVNTARGGIVDEEALYDALVSGHLAGAGLDVLEREPASPENPLVSLEQAVVTGHIGMYSREALNRVSVVCARNAAEALAGGAFGQ